MTLAPTIRVSSFVLCLVVPALAAAQIVTAPGPGAPPVVRVIESNGADRSLFAYPEGFGGGVFVALGDVDGDGTLDIITGAGPGGGPHVRVWNGVTLAEMGGFFAYDPAFPGGVRVAAGDVNGDGKADIITAAGPGGGPHVRVWSGADFTELGGFFAYDPAFPGGVTVASGDVNGDGRADIVTGPGPGGGPHVRVWSGATLGEIGGFFAYDPAFPGGVNVAAGDVNGDGRADVITGAGPGGGPHVRVWDGTTLGEIGGFFAYDPSFTGGVTVGAIDLTYDGKTEIITGPGPGFGPLVGIFNGADFSLMGAFFAFDPTFGGGVSIGSSGESGALRFTSANTTTFTVGTPGTFAITTVGGGSIPVLTLTGALPSGVTFTDNGDRTATLAGTPAAATGGSSALTLTATLSGRPPTTQTFTLTVNQAPAITSAAATTFGLGAPGTFTVTTTGVPAPSLTAAGPLPSGVTFIDNGDGTGTLSGTPAPGSGGPYVLAISASNGIGSDAVQSFTLTVSGTPAITSAATATFTVGSAGTFSVTAVGTPTPALAVSGALPAGITFVDNGNGTGTLSGTPAAGTGGAYAITFTATNGVLPNGTQAFTLNVNQAPAITSANATTFTVGAAGSFTVTTSGVPAAALARGGVALPAGVTFVDNGNGTGTLSGTPATGTAGTYAITFTATNTAGSSAPQAFTLTVNQPPAITSAASTAFTVGVAGSFTVTTTGFPTVGITRTGVALPGGVTFTDNGDGTGTLSGTPAAGTAGSYAIAFTAANGALPDAVQAFTLTVHQPPAITSAASTTFTVGTAGTFTVTTTGFPTPTVSQTGTLPAGVTFTPATRVLGGTATQTGAFPLVFAATNGVLPDATQNFTLNVVCPAITVTPATMTEGLYLATYGGVDFNQVGSTGSSFTWAATGLPAGLTINFSTGVVSGTPTNTVLNGTVVVTVTDNFGCVGSTSTALTVRPTTDNENYVGGVGNTQYVVAAAGPATPHVLFSDNVKTGDNGPGALSVTFGPAVNGTVSEGVTDGTFTYTPNVNFAGPTDTFIYTLTDGNGVTNTGTVTINLGNVVWYVNSAAGAGDGRSHNPFNTLSAAATPSGSTHIIYVHSGGATTTGNLAMDANQTVHGQGAAFTLNGLTIASGPRPTLTGTVTLADNTTVRAVNFTPAAIPAMTASGVSFAQPVTIDQVNVTGGTSALSLTNVNATATGAINVSNANFTNTTAAEVLISQGNIPVTLATTAVISSNAGRSVDVQNRTGGTVVFNGSIADTGQGIFLNANGPSTITFNGGLSLSTAGNPAFTATGGGIVSATQNNTTIVNVIATTTGTALNITNTTIRASGMTFRSISANGAANGIILNNTGALAGLTVTGNSSGLCGGAVGSGPPAVAASTTAPNAADCTGGTIQGSTGAGIVLTNTSGVSLTRLRVINSGNDGLQGTNVTGFTMNACLFDGNGNAINESGLDFGDTTSLTPNGLRGTGSITSSAILNSYYNGVSIRNFDGAALTSFNVTGSQFRANSANGDANDSLFFEASGTASITISVSSSHFSSIEGDHFQAAAANSGTLSIDFVNNTLAGGHATPLGQGITINAATGVAFGGYSGRVDYDVNGNNINGAVSNGASIVLGTSSAAAVFEGFVRNNVIGTSGVSLSCSTQANGVYIDARGNGTHTSAVTGNTIRQCFDRGILSEAGDGDSVLNLTVQSNVIDQQVDVNAREAIQTNYGITTTNVFGNIDTNTVCLQLGGAGALANTFSHGAGAPDDFRLRKRFEATVRLPGYAGGTSQSAPSLAQVVAFVQGQNVGSAGEPGSASASGAGGGYIGIASCTVPSF